jgi:serine/threonine protein kinase
MTKAPEKWKQVEQLFNAAMELEPAARKSFLAEACAGDEELRREVESLLAYENETAGFIRKPALEVAANALAADEREADQPKTISQQIGAYRIIELLGKGGMGEVYLAIDPRLGRRVAIKLLPTEFTADAERVRRFEQEARAASALNHPNIITIHEIGQADGAQYIVEEYIDGETLRQRMNRERMTLTEAPTILDVAIQIAAALAAAHEAGIIHRDIKPENVMKRRDGIVKVLDFGLAKLTEPSAPAVDTQAPTRAAASTETGVVMGTPRYMSPEQARGEKVDARTDIFSFGVVLYEMVAGHPPFAGATASETIAAILRDSPPPLTDHAPEAPRELERIVDKALGKNREERYQTIAELFSDLKDLKQELELQARAERPASTEGKKTTGAAMNISGNERKRKGLLFLASSLIVAIVVFAYFQFVNNRAPVIDSAEKPHPQATSEQQRAAKRYTDNTEAWQLCLKGNYYANRQSGEGFQKAIEHFRQALNLDPNYAPAWVGLAETYAWTGAMMGTLPPNDAFPKVKAAAQKALELDETLAEAHTSLAFYLFFYERNWAEAESEFKRALELNPNYPVARRWYARYLTAMGRHDEAIAEIKKAVELDPLSLNDNSMAAWILREARRYDEAIEQYRKTIEMDPNFRPAHAELGWAYLHKGMRQEAIAEFQKAIELAGISLEPGAMKKRVGIGPVGSLAYAYGMAGNRDEALRLVEELKRLATQSYVSPYTIAGGYIGLGDKDQAFAWLEKACKERVGWLVFLKVGPLYDPLRSDPRFNDLLRCVGFAP